MSMFCFQCQETAKNTGCTVRGVCGKSEGTAHLQDVLLYALKGLGRTADAVGGVKGDTGRVMTEALFTAITNANFNDSRIAAMILKVLEERDRIRRGLDTSIRESLPDCATWSGRTIEEFLAVAPSVGVLATENEDIRSLRELLIYGMKGIAAYAHHAAVLGYEDEGVYRFLVRGLAAVTKDLDADELVGLVMEAGKCAVDTMALLDRANTETYGNPEQTKVNIGVRNNPGILVSGHDLKDMETLLLQTKGTGVDVYTHSEMLPAHYYPAFKKYDHLAGNYGGSWWKQAEEFASFNGPILMTTNCITPVKDAYRDRIYTTGCAGYPGVVHIPDPELGGVKDFSTIIEQAKTCAPPTELEAGEIVGGFAHHQLSVLADTIVDAVKSGALNRFVVMAGCDGRFKDRKYFTDVAEGLPPGTVILTAGCAKYRYNKLPLGDIGGIPRVIDAGQCNDSYSLAVTALKLAEVFGAADINDLPISFDIAWYEQKAVAVLLALLSLGVRGIRLGPTLPAFLSPNVAKVLVEKFDIKPVGDSREDIAAMMAGN